MLALLGAGLLLAARTPALGQTPDPTATPTTTPVSTYTLTTIASPAGRGTLTGAGTYAAGAVVTVTITPNFGYRFDRWSGDCTGMGACHVTMNADRSVTAHFVVHQTYTLATSAAPSDGGSISWSGPWTNVIVTATPNFGYRFERWSGDCTGSGACSLIMTADRSVTAHFVRFAVFQTHTLTMRASPSDGGSLGWSGDWTNVTVTATPNSGYRFQRWAGDCTGSGACFVTLNAARSVTAHFTRTYVLTASASPSGGGSVSGGGTYDTGTNVTVTATPSSGYRFDRWSGDCTGSGACSVSMNAARSVTAHFVARHTLTTSVSPSPGGSVSAGGTYDDGTDVAVTATANLGYRFLECSPDHRLSA